MLKKLLGVLEAAVVFGGLAGLVTGMYLLATSPLPGVVVMLASMAMLVSSVKKLGAGRTARIRRGPRAFFSQPPLFR